MPHFGEGHAARACPYRCPSLNLWSPRQSAFRHKGEVRCHRPVALKKSEAEHEGESPAGDRHADHICPNPCFTSNPWNPASGGFRHTGEASCPQTGVCESCEARHAVPQTFARQAADVCPNPCLSSTPWRSRQGVFRHKGGASCPQIGAFKSSDPDPGSVHEACAGQDACFCPNPCFSSNRGSPLHGAFRNIGEASCPQTGAFQTKEAEHESVPQTLVGQAADTCPNPCPSPILWSPSQGASRLQGEVKCPKTGELSCCEVDQEGMPHGDKGHSDVVCPNPCSSATPGSPLSVAFKTQEKANRRWPFERCECVKVVRGEHAGKSLPSPCFCSGSLSPPRGGFREDVLALGCAPQSPGTCAKGIAGSDGVQGQAALPRLPPIGCISNVTTDRSSGSDTCIGHILAAPLASLHTVF